MNVRHWIDRESSGGSRNYEKGAKHNLSAPSSFIANAHNEIYALYTEKSAPPPLPPLNRPLGEETANRWMAATRIHTRWQVASAAGGDGGWWRQRAVTTAIGETRSASSPTRGVLLSSRSSSCAAQR